LGALAGVVGIGMLPLAGATSASGATEELFVTEYVEGSSNNKALEIYNGTGAPVDLAGGGYNVQMFFNGSTSAGLTINLTGTVADEDVFVLAQANASAPILAQADQTNGSGWFNGDDAVVLRKGTTVLDVIGQIGFDPGTEWGSGLASTADNTLRRKASVVTGDTNGADAFDPAAEWDGFATDTFDGLGAHSTADVPPTVASTVPPDGGVDVPQDQTLSVTFSEPVNAVAGAFSLSCGGSDIAVTVSGGPQTFSIDPDSDLAIDVACTLTVSAAAVTDQDGDPDPMAADYVTGFTTFAGPLCERDITPIYDIQGVGSSAAITGPVTTRGVVVGDYEEEEDPGTLRGFYLQDATGDADVATSDGIFVFNGSANDVSLGDVVTVTGNAGEFQDQTQIGAGGADDVAVCSSGASVDPADVTLPFADEADQERFEGMLVTLPQTLFVTETFQLGRFGQVSLSSGGRLAQPTNVVAPGALAQALQAANDLNQILLDDASQRQNPDPIPWGRDGKPLSAANTLRGGDTTTDTTGVMTYTWAGNAASGNAFRVRPINAMDGFAEFEGTNRRRPAPGDVGGDLRIASFNVLNYFNTFGDNCRPVGPENDTMCRGAENSFEFERQADKIVAAIEGLDADAIGVIEIENDGYGPDSALQDLVNRLNAVAGAGTYDFIDADTATGEVDSLGDDAIKVGMVYKPDNVTPVGRTAVLNTDSFVNGDSGEPRNRPALAQTFQDADGGRVTVVVNHLKSKGSDCNADGDPDIGDGQGNCNQTRLDSAVEMAEWLAGDPTAVDDSDALIMGDLNSYAMEDPITALKDVGYTDLVLEAESAAAYSFVFDGQWGYLDHALSSASLTDQVTGTTTWHINADEPPVLDYNTNFKSADQITRLYAPDAFRSSDHDPVLVGLDLEVGTRVTDGFVTGSGTYAADGGTAQFDFGVLYTPRMVAPSGEVTLDVPGVGDVAGTSFTWLATDRESGLATFSGPVTLDGVGGYVLTTYVTDAGKADDVRFVLTDSGGSVVYDSGIASVVEGNVTVH
jgi:uncharacterized protein